MITFSEFTLPNGLRCIVHEDFTTSMAVLNVLYDVGSRDEDPAHTGFAHLFEHLMFSGSVNIPSYDEPLQRVGGENNAFTSTDVTNYYLSLPAANLETGFWLESDRMLNLAFSDHGLEVQRKVVVEEFKQTYLNQPYGDVWLQLKPLAYQQHPLPVEPHRQGNRPHRERRDGRRARLLPEALRPPKRHSGSGRGRERRRRPGGWPRSGLAPLPAARPTAAPCRPSRPKPRPGTAAPAPPCRSRPSTKPTICLPAPMPATTPWTC